MKDMNFLEISQEVNMIKLQPGEKQLLEEIIELDSKFLESLGLMDYSLLLVVEQVPFVNESGPNASSMMKTNWLSVSASNIDRNLFSSIRTLKNGKKYR
jgi:hypothetical protein